MSIIQLNSRSDSRVFPQNDQLFITQEAKCPFITKARIQKVALIALGFLVMGAVTASPFLFTPVYFLFPLICLGVYCLIFPIMAVVFASQIKDYENPMEVAMMRDKAIFLDYKDLIKEHGAPKRILHARILFPQELLSKLEESEKAERASIHQLEKLQKDRAMILDWEASLKLRLERLEKCWV